MPVKILANDALVLDLGLVIIGQVSALSTVRLGTGGFKAMHVYRPEDSGIRTDPALHVLRLLNHRGHLPARSVPEQPSFL